MSDGMGNDATPSGGGVNLAVLAMLDSASEEKVQREAKSGGGNFCPRGYPQAGNSTIRVFPDPKMKLYRTVKYFNLGDQFTEKGESRLVYDPRFYINGVDSEGTEIPKSAVEKVWQLANGFSYNLGREATARFEVLAYVHVYAADLKDEKYWMPNNFYLGGFNGRFETSLLTQFNNLKEDAIEEVVKMLDPAQAAMGFKMDLVKGQSGSVTLTPTIMKPLPAVEINEDHYLPLDQQVVSDVYSQAGVDRLIAFLEAKREEYELDIDDEGADDKSSAPSSGVKKDAKKEEVKSEAKAEEKAPEKESEPEVKSEESALEVEAEATSAPSEANNWGLTEEEVAFAAAAKLDNKTYANAIGRI